MNEKNIAYLILAHQDFENLERLINQLDYKADFFIHIDGKIEIDEIKKNYKDRSNIYFIENRYFVNWAGFNMVLATQELIRLAIEKDNNYSHLILLSGGDYPIKNNKYIYDYFTSNDNVEFIRAYGLNEIHCRHCEERVTKYWFFDSNVSKNSVINKIFRKILTTIASIKNKNRTINVKNNQLEVCFGSQWWAITMDCAKYILNYIDENKEINNYFKSAYAPDEMYFHTIIFNSPYANKTMNNGIEEYSKKWRWNNLHYLKTETLDCDYTQGKKTIIEKLFKKFNGSISPCTEKDFENIKNSEYLYMRKVNSTESRELLNLIDEII